MSRAAAEQVKGMDAPFVARIEGRRLYGRGAACDLTFLAAVAEAWEEIAMVVRAFAEHHPSGAEFAINRPFVDHRSMETPTHATIVKALSAALERYAPPAVVVGAPFGSDASRLACAGTPCVVLRPRRIEEAHSNDEHVDRDEVAHAAHALVALAAGL